MNTNDYAALAAKKGWPIPILKDDGTVDVPGVSRTLVTQEMAALKDAEAELQYYKLKHDRARAEFLRQMVDGAPPARLARYPDKARIASEFLLSGSDESGSLSAEAAARGKNETPEQLATKISEKAARYRNICARIDAWEDVGGGADDFISIFRAIKPAQ